MILSLKKFIGSKSPNVWKKSAVVSLCAVLFAVSAFFYAPMDVDAEEVSTSINVSPIELSGNDFHELDIPAVEAGLAGYNNGYVSVHSSVFDLIDESLDLDEFYAVTVNGLVTVRSDSAVYLRNGILSYSTNQQIPPFLFFKRNPDGSTGDSMTSYYNISTVLYCYGRDLVNKRLFFDSRTLSLVPDAINFTFDFDIKASSVVKLTGSESASYQQGYNAGYSAGEQAGQDIGYSNGYEVGFEQGENQGYESGFEAGKDSVDTQSFYDMGYSAGYDAGYLSGYDEGYDEGYDAALSSLQGSSSSQSSLLHLGYVEDIEKSGTPFYVSSYGLVDMEEYQSGVNGYFYNTVPGTYSGLSYITYEVPFYTLNNKQYPKFTGDSVRFQFSLRNVFPSLTVDSGSASLYANLVSSKIREVYVTYKGHKYYGSFSSGTIYGEFDFLVDDFATSGPHTLFSGDMTITFVLENSVTIITDSDRSHFVSAIYTPKVSFDLGNSSSPFTITSFVVNDRVSANIQNQTNEITGALEQQKEVQENQLEEQKEQTETQKGIAQSIKDFFGSFFDNLINSIIHVIVPTKEEMGELFNRLNDFFSETFGFLYYPFEFIINAFNIFLVADSGTGLTLPAFSIMGYEVWGSQTYDIASEPIVGEIFGFVRMGTGAMLVMWFVNFLKDFFDKRFGGGGS